MMRGSPYPSKSAWIKHFALVGSVLLGLSAKLPAAEWQISNEANAIPGGVALSSPGGAVEIVIDASDFDVVKEAASLLSADVERVSGKHPTVREGAPQGKQIVLAGTLGHSPLIDQLAQQGSLKNLDAIRGKWETTSWQMVDHPLPGVDRAFVVVGSDRRGTAYGLMEISARIGVSPWYWWADVRVAHHETVVVQSTQPDLQSPSVKYRGIFINDEDWGLQLWAANTFDPQFKNIGPKTYEKVFELMLRLKLNYLWPAMHPCSTEFGSVKENVLLADKYAIVMGASHCEPMLRNNVWWPKDKGPWRYDTNRENMRDYWREWAKARGPYEGVWTLGLRGIHDAGMDGPRDMAGKINVLKLAITDQRELLDQNVDKRWGPTAQCFVPYKEVQPIYDAGLEVPPDVTLVWADDNFGYLRRLSSPEERKRSGGSGFYYHLSYYGGPHSYCWINTTPPALMREEMRKAWDNDARTLWVVNVGDIKPMEIGISYFAHLAWNAAAPQRDTQPEFLHDFSARTFGPEHADEIASLLAEFYRLGQIRKPETMERSWAMNRAPNQIAVLMNGYQGLLKREKTLAAKIPPNLQDAWTELVGYPARALAGSGLIFTNDYDAQNSDPEFEKEVQKWHAFIDTETVNYNERVAGGKWFGMMPVPELRNAPGEWATLVRWPWMEKPAANGSKPPRPSSNNVPYTRAAANFTRKSDQRNARWVASDGLGYSGKALVLEPASLQSAWDPSGNDPAAPRLEYDFETTGPAPAEAHLYCLPTFRIYPGMKLRVAVSVDDAPTMALEVPGSDGSEDENGPIRRNAVRNNRVDLRIPFSTLAAGKHTLKIRAVDPGLVLDEIALPENAP